MKVRITKASEGPISICAWWYESHVGEEFEVEEDRDRPEYFLTPREHKGKPLMHHIRKDDCEVIP